MRARTPTVPGPASVSPDRQKAEDALVGAHLLGDVLAADIEVQPAYAADRAVELDPGLAEAVARQLPLEPLPMKKAGTPHGVRALAAGARSPGIGSVEPERSLARSSPTKWKRSAVIAPSA